MPRRPLALAAALAAAVGCTQRPTEVRRVAGTVGLSAGALAVAPAGSLAAVPLSGTGTAVIDGALAPGEWDGAATADFAANVPPTDGGGTVPARLYVMNDAQNLYLGLRVEASFHGGATFSVEIDRDLNGMSDGDDALVATGLVSGETIFADAFRWTCGGAMCGVRDTDVYSWAPAPGTSDGAGVTVNAGGAAISEISHPFASGDAVHDMQVAAGDVVGIRISFRNLDACPSWPACFGDTDFPTGAYLMVAISPAGPVPPPADPPPPTDPPPTDPLPPADPPMPPAPLEVAIDVKPAHPDSPAPMNLGARGTVPVAVLGSATFYVPSVDVESVRFAGAPVARRSDGMPMAAVEDVNGDGEGDLVLHFDMRALALAANATTAVLEGSAGGVPFRGEDSIRIVR